MREDKVNLQIGLDRDDDVEAVRGAAKRIINGLEATIYELEEQLAHQIQRAQDAERESNGWEEHCDHVEMERNRYIDSISELQLEQMNLKRVIALLDRLLSQANLANAQLHQELVILYRDQGYFVETEN